MNNRNKIVSLYQTSAAEWATGANAIRLDIMDSMKRRCKRWAKYAALDYAEARKHMGLVDTDQYYA